MEAELEAEADMADEDVGFCDIECWTCREELSELDDYVPADDNGQQNCIKCHKAGLKMQSLKVAMFSTKDGNMFDMPLHGANFFQVAAADGHCECDMWLEHLGNEAVVPEAKAAAAAPAAAAATDDATQGEEEASDIWWADSNQLKYGKLIAGALLQVHCVAIALSMTAMLQGR